MPAEGVPEKPLVTVTSVGPPDARRLLFRPSTGARLLPRLLSLNHIEKMGKVRHGYLGEPAQDPRRRRGARPAPRTHHSSRQSVARDPVQSPDSDGRNEIFTIQYGIWRRRATPPNPRRPAHYLDAAFPLAPSSRDSNGTTRFVRSTASRHLIRRDLDARAGTGGEPCRRPSLGPGGSWPPLDLIWSDSPIRAVRRADPRPRPRRRSLAIECRSLSHPSDRACSAECRSLTASRGGGPSSSSPPPSSPPRDAPYVLDVRDVAPAQLVRTKGTVRAGFEPAHLAILDFESSPLTTRAPNL